MKLTTEIIKNHGFKRINKSMFKLDNVTLQNTHITKGTSLYERILNVEYGYKMCVDGKFFKNIVTERELVNSLNKIANR